MSRAQFGSPDDQEFEDLCDSTMIDAINIYPIWKICKLKCPLIN